VQSTHFCFVAPEPALEKSPSLQSFLHFLFVHSTHLLAHFVFLLQA